MITAINIKNILIPTTRIINNTTRLLIVNNRRFQSTESTSTSEKSSHDATSKPVEYYDIVICGGGMVGTAMARSLAKDSLFKNLKIALVESSPKSGEYKTPEIYKNRVCAINDKSIQLFKTLDCFDFIEQNRYGIVKHMHVWDGSSDSFITFHGDQLALTIENDLIQASLSHNIDKFENLDVIYSSEIKDFKSSADNVNIKLNNGKELNTKLLIGSDGANSFIRNKAEFKITKWDYDQVGIVATLKLADRQTNYTAWQRFLSTGPIALLPLNDQYSSLVWSIKKSLAKELLEMPDDQFAQQVNHAYVKEDYKNTFASKINQTVEKIFDFVKDSKFIPQADNLISANESQCLPPKIETCEPKTRAAFPLNLMHSNNYVKDRIALIGDAVHRIHPLAGQGVNLGFGDIVCLTKALRQNVLNGSEIGSNLYLKQYESERQKEAFPKVVGIDVLYRLYTDIDYPIKTPLVAARSVGLTISNRVAPLKNFFIKQAMQ